MQFSPKVLRCKDQEVADNQVCLDIKHRFSKEVTECSNNIPGDYSNINNEQARQIADLIIKKAWAEADSIIQNTKIQSAAKTLEYITMSKEEGFREGYRDGYQQALEEAAVEAEKIRVQARDVLSAAEEERRKILRRMEDEMINLARDMAEKIVCNQLNMAPELVVDIARQCLSMVEAREKTTVYVNPGELEIFEMNRSELQQLLPGGTALYIIPDSMVQPGGCKLEADQTEIDASLAVRWQVLWEHISKGKGRGA